MNLVTATHCTALRHVYAALLVALSFYTGLYLLVAAVLLLYVVELVVRRRKSPIEPPSPEPIRELAVPAESNERPSILEDHTVVDPSPAFSSIERLPSGDRSEEPLPIIELSDFGAALPEERTVADNTADPWSKAIQAFRNQEAGVSTPSPEPLLLSPEDEIATPLEPIFHHDFQLNRASKRSEGEDK